MTLARDHTVADGARYLASWTAAMFHTTDVAEGSSTFREKRPTSFEDLPPKRRS